MSGAVLSEGEYKTYRFRLAALFVLRVVCAGGLIWIWDELDTLQKAVAIGVAFVVVPGLSTLRKVFMPYARYLRENASLPKVRE